MDDMISFTTADNLQKQDIAVSKSIRKYILKNASAKLFRKLYQTCKYFYLNAPYFIVDEIDFIINWANFPISDKVRKTYLYDVNRLLFIDNIWVTKTGWIKIQGNQEQCHSLISKIVRCEVTKLRAMGATLIKDDFEKLVKFGTIEDTCFMGVKVLNEDGSKVPIEDLLILLLPNALAIQMDNFHVTPKTIEKLFSVKQKWKLNKFCLRELDGPINVDEFFKFVKLRCTPKAEIDIRFRYKNSYKFSLNFTKTINSLIDGEEEPVAKRRKLENDPAAEKALEKKKLQEKVIPFKTHGFIATQTFGSHQRRPLINYIIENANAKVLQKLYRTCKYFYNKRPYYFVDEIEWNTLFDQYLKFVIDGDDFEDELKVYSFNQVKQIKNIWITDWLNLYNSENNPINEIIPKIVKCDAKTIWLSNITFSLNEFNILTESGKVTEWKSERCGIINDEEYLVSFGYILSRLPKATEIIMFPCGVTSNTDQELEALPKNKLIEKLHLLDIENLIDPNTFFNFIRKSVIPKAEIRLIFDDDLIEDDDEIDEFKTDLKELIEELWDPKNDDDDKPSLEFVTWDEWNEEMDYA